MKTYRHLYAQITEFENLRLAFRGAARGKRSHADVAAFEFDLERNLLQLQAELRAQAYVPGAYGGFRVFGPRPRLISAAPLRDGVADDVLFQLDEPPRQGFSPTAPPEPAGTCLGSRLLCHDARRPSQGGFPCVAPTAM